MSYRQNRFTSVHYAVSPLWLKIPFARESALSTIMEVVDWVWEASYVENRDPLDVWLITLPVFETVTVYGEEVGSFVRVGNRYFSIKTMSTSDWGDVALARGRFITHHADTLDNFKDLMRCSEWDRPVVLEEIRDWVGGVMEGYREEVINSTSDCVLAIILDLLETEAFDRH